MAEMKGIKLCGECGNYDFKKHKCRIGCNDDSNAQASFYGDCPLPDVVPKSEVAKEIFAEIEKIINRYCKDYKYSIADVLLDIGELKKKYTEGKNEKGSN